MCLHHHCKHPPTLWSQSPRHAQTGKNNGITQVRVFPFLDLNMRFNLASPKQTQPSIFTGGTNLTQSQCMKPDNCGRPTGPRHSPHSHAAGTSQNPPQDGAQNPFSKLHPPTHINTSSTPKLQYSETPPMHYCQHLRKLYELLVNYKS